MIKDNNGSFISTLSMQLCRVRPAPACRVEQRIYSFYVIIRFCSHFYLEQDNLYKELLIIPEEGLSPRTEIYVAVKATELSDRY